jgi:hypothetical protein
LSLFDHFPVEQQNLKIQEWVVPGAIVYLSCSWIQKAYKNKYLVVGSVGPECLMLMANTNPYFAAPSTTQVQLLQANYADSLAWNTFVDCNSVVTQLTFNGVVEQIKGDGGRYKGKLTADDQQQVVAAIKFATDIPPIHQEMLIESLAA